MQRYREVKDEIGINQQLKMLMQAYQEHAIVQINFARYSVVSSREFMQELTEIFSNVKSSYQAVIAAKQRKHKKETDPFAKNGKEALVLLSSNGKFYGDLVTKVCRIFEEQAKTTDADIVIIGKEGRSYYESTKINKPYTYFELPDTNVPLVLLEPVIQKLISYERVTIFYGKFDNIIVQEPVKASLSGDMAPTTQEGGKQQEEFLFEPSVENVMAFFESQIFSLLLNQTVNEGKLARFASRIKAMEIAQNNLQKQLKLLNSREKRLKSMEMNKKQLQLFAGRSLWNK